MLLLPDYKKDSDGQAIVNTFKNYSNSEACVEINKILDINIKKMIDKILDGEYSTPDELLILRTHVLVFRSIKTLPETIIDRMTEVDSVQNSLDPYDTLETMKQK